MHFRLAVAGLAAALALGVPSGPSHAQFGFGRVVPRVPVIVPRIGPRGIFVVPLLTRRAFRRTFGVFVVAAVGAGILQLSLNVSERREVARRTKHVVENDPNQEVVDTYQSKDGRKTVKITASPIQPVEYYKDDPALKLAAEEEEKANAETKTAKNEKKKKNTKEAAKDEQAELPIKFAELPPSTNCRKVQTEFEQKPTGKKSAEPTTSVNAAIVCKMPDGEWRPAAA